MSNFKQLDVWQKAFDLSIRVDKLAKRIAPTNRKLADQLAEAAASIPACIAEGRGRGTDPDFAHYVSMAIGSTNEAENHLLRGYQGGLVPTAEHESLVEASTEVRKMLVGLRKVLRGKPPKPNSSREAPPEIESEG